MDNKGYEPIRPLRPGDKVLRRRMPSRRKQRLLPNLFGLPRAFRDFAIRTPFVPMLPVIVLFWLVFSTGFYFAEVGAPGTGIDSYGEALWAGVVLMTTAGTLAEPVTTAGYVVGALWTVIGCLLFYGTIIASASAYFLLPLSSYFLLSRRRPSGQLVGTIQYNFDRLEELSPEDLEALRETVHAVIDAELARRKRRGSVSA
ncbi:MAG: two pore domain potassium channel family protein [Chloroflexota bacterium]|nr:two pore domain potassium channel family protein [Chloroflexota bacterium]